MQPRRSRLRVTVFLIVTIALGLGSRSGFAWIPDWIAQNVGDTLWAVAVFAGLALLQPAAAPRALLVGTLAISLCVELSQLSHAGWLEELRSSRFARLFLGSGWRWADLPRYAVGALLAWATDVRGLLTRSRARAESQASSSN